MAANFIIAKEPRLSWSALLPGIRKRPGDAWRRKKNVFNLYLARNGIYHGLAALGLKPGENVLVPAFHCAAVVDPIEKYGGAVKFYGVNSELSPNFDDIIDNIDARTRAILIIHYFGFPQPVREFRQLCDARKLFLIEDCAHVLTGKTEEGIELGDSGDVSVFSWRKFLPLNDGAQLVINNPALRLKIDWQKAGLLFSLKSVKNALERLSDDASESGGDRFSLIGVLRSCLTGYGRPMDPVAALGLNANSYQVDFNLDVVNIRMSAVSKYIFDGTDFAAVADARRRNYRTIARAVASMQGVTALHKDASANICPWVFPLLSSSVKDLHLKLRARGIPATTWGGVIHPSLPIHRFPKAQNFYDNLVFLPIHQCLADHDIEKLISILRESLCEKVQVHAQCVNDSVSLPAF